jgi:heterodisulfide reductase subunit A
MSRFLILGGGISGCTAGTELAGLGHQVTILEQSARFGGKLLDYCCKATDSCSRCGVCVAASQVARAARQQGLRILAGAELKAVRRGAGFTVQAARRNPSIDPGRCVDCGACARACPAGAITRQQKAELVQYVVDYTRCRLQQGKSCDRCLEACPAGAIELEASAAQSELRLKADALLLATGHQPFDAARKIRLGYGRFPGVLTGAEAEELLSRQESLGGSSVAFVQCVGSRDPQEGNNYCSAVCCAYAMRLARVLRHREPGTEVAIYYIDLQNFDKAFGPLRAELQASGVRFLRGVPFRVEQTSSGRLALYFESPDGQESVAEHDRVILSVGIRPEPRTAGLAGLLGLPLNAHGFLASANPAAQVWACGTCLEPQSIPDCMASARAVALDMVMSLETAGRLA